MVSFVKKYKAAGSVSTPISQSPVGRIPITTNNHRQRDKITFQVNCPAYEDMRLVRKTPSEVLTQRPVPASKETFDLSVRTR
jgi:hypothetical protein